MDSLQAKADSIQMLINKNESMSFVEVHILFFIVLLIMSGALIIKLTFDSVQRKINKIINKG